MHEPEHERIVAALEANPVCRISAASLPEAPIVARARRQPTMRAQSRRFIDETGAALVPFDEQQARLADAACPSHGKGRGHPAPRDLGDGAVHAPAKARGEPLLSVGQDCSQTRTSRDAGCERVFAEAASGAKRDRAALDAAL